jgi:outer membrane immunogenic protein
MCRFILSLVASTILPMAAASAADIPLKAPPPPAPAPLSWTGFYLGGEVGYGWATEQVTHVTGATSFPAGSIDRPIDNLNGALGGIYGGYNYQFNPSFLAGVDADITWAAMNGTGTDVSPVNGNIAHHTDEIDWISTVTGRLGYVANNWLFFGKGGWAWSQWGTGGSLNTPAGGIVNGSSGTSDRQGWTAGGGIEYAYSPHVLFKIEYDYVGFDTAHYTVLVNNIAGAAAGTTTVEARSSTSSVNIVKGGIAYRF